MKRIVIDMSSAQPQGSMKVNGGGEFSMILLYKLFESKLFEITVCINSTRGINNRLEDFIFHNSIKKVVVSSVQDFSNYLTNSPDDVLILPVCYDFYCDLDVGQKKVIAIIHDLSNIFYAKLNGTNERYYKCDSLDNIRKIKNKLLQNREIKKAIQMHNRLLNSFSNVLVITVSEYSRQTMRSYLNIRDSVSIEVIESFTDDNECFDDVVSENQTLQEYKIEHQKYFLLSSMCRWQKNNIIAVRAIDQLFSQGDFQGYKCVILGSDSLSDKYLKKILKNKERFVIKDYVESEVLQILYKHAHLFVYPSLFEGWGGPPIEAMKYGTVSACSVATSISEVCQNAVIYFEPYDVISIKTAILRTKDKEYMDYLRKLMEKRIDVIRFNQAESVKKIIHCIEA